MKHQNKPRQRFQFKFWLDAYVQVEYSIMESIAILKSERKFAATMRNALRLIIDLSAGNIDVLLELFPWVKDRLNEEQTTSPTPQPPPIPDPKELAREIATQIILQGGADKILMQSTGQQTDSSRTGQGAKMLTQQQFALPTFDDDEAETQPAIAVTKNTGVDSFGNFLANASGVANFLGGISALK